MTSITIQQIASADHISQAETIQKVVWNRDDRDIIPWRLMLDLVRNGCGVLVGAMDHDKLLGFAFAIYGTIRREGRDREESAGPELQMLSLIVGVLPSHQNLGLGYQLKLAQRSYAREVGIGQISWVYDPLISRNAWLNIGKLGATCRTYFRNYYGKLSGLDSGLETDRFSVTWSIDSDHVQKRLQGRRRYAGRSLLNDHAFLVNEASFDESGMLLPSEELLDPAGHATLAVEIPADFHNLKRCDLPLAHRWRAHTRHLFEGLFEAGFWIVDFVTQTTRDPRNRSYYILTQEE